MLHLYHKSPKVTNRTNDYSTMPIMIYYCQEEPLRTLEYLTTINKAITTKIWGQILYFYHNTRSKVLINRLPSKFCGYLSQMSSQYGKVNTSLQNNYTIVFYHINAFSSLIRSCLKMFVLLFDIYAFPKDFLDVHTIASSNKNDKASHISSFQGPI